MNESVERSNKIARWMIDGVRSDANPAETLATNCIFLDDHPEQIDIKKGIQTTKLDSAFSTIVKYDKGRLTAGINPSTIMTEYRRKVVIEALMNPTSSTSTENVKDHEIHDLACRKLKKYLEVTKSFQQEKGKAANERRLSHRSADMDKSKISNISNGRDTKKPDKPKYGFNPSWQDYDTMKVRWQYIQPQIRELVQYEHMLAPSSPDPCVAIEDEKLFASYVDVERFRSQSSSVNSWTSTIETPATNSKPK